jgi:hypothetical protein
VALLGRDLERAEALHKESLALSKELGGSLVTLVFLEGLACDAGAKGEAARAARLFGAAQALREAMGVPLQPALSTLEEPYLVGWFQDHPYLKTSEPESAKVGGVKGEQIDMVVEVPGGYYGACGSDCMDIYWLGGGETMAWDDGDKVRIIVLDVKGETVSVDSSVSEASEFDEFMTEAQKVVDSVKWGGS